MKKYSRCLFLTVCLFGLAFLLSGSTEKKTGIIKISIDNLKNNKGQVLISIFNQKNGFPGEYEKALKYTAAGIDNKTALTDFEDVPAGEYAIATVHDENSNNSLDKNVAGIPKEGYGVSNNPPARLGPPLYKDAKFTFNPDDETSGILNIRIKMIY